MKTFLAAAALLASVAPAAAVELPAALRGDWCATDNGNSTYRRGRCPHADAWLKIGRRRIVSPYVDCQFVGAVGAKYHFKCAKEVGDQVPTLSLDGDVLSIQYPK